MAQHAAAVRRVGVADRLRKAMTGDLVEVGVEGRRRWALQDEVAALQTAAPPTVVRLLPPRDPFVNGDDRLVRSRPGERQAGPPRDGRTGNDPDRHRADRDLASPAGRARAAGQVAAVHPAPEGPHRELEEQARAVGRARGADDVDLTVVDAS